MCVSKIIAYTLDGPIILEDKDKRLNHHGQDGIAETLTIVIDGLCSFFTCTFCLHSLKRAFILFLSEF